MRSLFLTDRGRVRQHNEDAGGVFYNQANQILAIIADGMGGHQAGDVASQKTVSIIKEKWEELGKLSSPIESESWLKQTIQEVNKEVYQCSQAKKELEGMGTTLVVAILSVDYVSIAHIGDSRCYIQNQNGFNQITEDHSLVNALVRAGEITEEDAKKHPRNNIVSRALGTDLHVEIDTECLNIENDDKLLLCTDGLTDKVSNDELKEYLSRDESIKLIGRDLIELANDRGGDDNISLIIISDCSDSKAGEKSCS